MAVSLLLHYVIERIDLSDSSPLYCNTYSPRHSRALLADPQRRDIINARGEGNEPKAILLAHQTIDKILSKKPRNAGLLPCRSIMALTAYLSVQHKWDCLSLNLI